MSGSAGIRHGVRVQQVAELADAVGEARAGARVVGVAVDDDDAGVRRDPLEVEVGGAAGGLLGVEAARRDDEQLGIGGRDGVPGRRVRRPAGLGEEGLAARGLDHPGQPVAGHERRVDPLGDEDARSVGAGPERGLGRAADVVDRLAHLAGDLPPPLRHAEPRRERLDRCRDLVERGWVERDHLGADRAGRPELARADRAHRAQVLGDDHVRRAARR